MNTPPFWNTRTLASTLLSPLAWAYRLGNHYDRTHTRAAHAPIPVISVGNATVGGAGKTPTTLALVPLLRAIGATPHLLVRGYKGEASQGTHAVAATDDWRRVGDEALLLARAAPTWVGASRLASATAAAKAGATLVVADDAHQHYRLHKNISLLVIDGPYGIGNGRLLPAGPLREPFAAALARADAVILIGDDHQQLTRALRIPVFRASLKPRGDTAFLATTPWLAFAGIGRPEKFFTSLRTLGASVIATCPFPDHHAYREADAMALMAEANRLGARLITTEKDAVKLPPALAAVTATLAVDLVFEDAAGLTHFLNGRLT